MNNSPGALAPQHLQVLDESHMHSRGQETHYKAVIVSEQFAGLNSVKRHQKVYATMGELMGQIHALAIPCLHRRRVGQGRRGAGLAGVRRRRALKPFLLFW